MIKTCATCKYKETAGQMVDPCFPCLQDHSIWTGEPKAKYDAWTDERLSWEEIHKQYEEGQAAIQRVIEELPEFRAMIEALKQTINK